VRVLVISGGRGGCVGCGYLLYQVAEGLCGVWVLFISSGRADCVGCGYFLYQVAEGVRDCAFKGQGYAHIG
jgi:predicted aconitase with swiveling domain